MQADPENYRWPAEWEGHAATWVAWPVNANTWPGLFERIPPAFARFVAAVSRFEPVRILAGSESVIKAARPFVVEACSAVESCHSVDFVEIPVNDSWCRDHGPIFLNRRPNVGSGPEQIVIDWDYNAWGEKYPPWDQDAKVAGRIAARLDMPAVRPELILEGGSVDGNGAGTILTTESCLLNPNRNRGITRERMEAALRRFMGARNVVWLPGHGILGDDTDGHVDQVARFADARRVLVAAPYSDDAPEAKKLRANFKAVANGVNADGQPLDPIPLKLPKPLFQQKHRLPASYCNFYIVNGAVIVPLFQDRADETAMQQIQNCFPDHEIAGVDALDLIWGLGAFHCMTQQQPLKS
ncbi:MAG: agmatine deiminase family protein [Planctomycetaceae bacterium]